MCTTPTSCLRVLCHKTYIELIPIIEESSVRQKHFEQKTACSSEESEPLFSLYEDDGHEGLS